MDGEKKFVVVLFGAGMVCLTVLYTFLFLSLWLYKEWVGGSLLLVLFLVVGVYLRGKLGEQNLRHVRYRHQEETPLDVEGEPLYWHQGMQMNPHRVGSSSSGSEYRGYEAQQQDWR